MPQFYDIGDFMDPNFVSIGYFTNLEKHNTRKTDYFHSLVRNLDLTKNVLYDQNSDLIYKNLSHKCKSTFLVGCCESEPKELKHYLVDKRYSTCSKYEKLMLEGHCVPKILNTTFGLA